MTSSKQLVLLLAIALVAGAAAHRLGLGAVLDGDLSPHRSLLDKREVSAEAVERQRILAELEEVHQLRERMLQEAGTYVSSNAEAPAPVPPPSPEENNALLSEPPPSGS